MSLTKADLVRTSRQRLATAGAVHAVEMTAVLNALEAALEVAEALDGLTMPPDTREKSTVQAEAGRQLNRLGDILDIVQAEVKSEYWRLKGYADPRE